MEAEFWHSRWQEGRLGFHEPTVNPRLVSHWDALGLERGASVFVPLCGKSLDLTWLAERGHTVLGVELSEIAVQAYFEERGIVPTVREETPFRSYAEGETTLLCGDIFALDELPPGKAEVVPGFYDRGSLVALPEPLRVAYAQHLGRLMPVGARGLLVALEYDQAVMSGPPFSLADAEIHALFEESFEVRLLAEESGPQVVGRLAGRGLATLREMVFSLERRQA